MVRVGFNGECGGVIPPIWLLMHKFLYSMIFKKRLAKYYCMWNLKEKFPNDH